MLQMHTARVMLVVQLLQQQRHVPVGAHSICLAGPPPSTAAATAAAAAAAVAAVAAAAAAAAAGSSVAVPGAV